MERGCQRNGSLSPTAASAAHSSATVPTHSTATPGGAAAAICSAVMNLRVGGKEMRQGDERLLSARCCRVSDSA